MVNKDTELLRESQWPLLSILSQKDTKVSNSINSVHISIIMSFKNLQLAGDNF
jgi:hypothetical protein